MLDLALMMEICGINPKIRGPHCCEAIITVFWEVSMFVPYLQRDLDTQINGR